LTTWAGLGTERRREGHGLRGREDEHPEASTAGSGATRRPAASAALRARRPVLLVDDRGWDREALAEALRARGVRPMTLPGPERALALCARREVRLDAVVFPARVRGGAEALARGLAELRPEVPRVVVVGDDECAASAQALFALAVVTCAGDAADTVRAACDGIAAGTSTAS
jgi:ActR/RegA family two-component response regulator